LEAMAAGVPIVAEDRGGWLEMIQHGRTGYLCDTSAAVGDYVRRLAAHEPRRLRIAQQAREAVVDTLAAPEPIWREWERMFKELGA